MGRAQERKSRLIYTSAVKAGDSEESRILLGVLEYECQCQQDTMEEHSQVQWLVVKDHLFQTTLYFHYEQPI